MKRSLLAGFVLLLALIGWAGSRSLAKGWVKSYPLTSDVKVNHHLSINFARAVAADSAGNVHAVWFDDRSGKNQVYYRRSPDNGKTWGAAVRVSDGEKSSEHPAVAVSGSRVYIVWHEFTRGGPKIYFRCFEDYGKTWESRTWVSGGQGAHASVAASGSDVYVVWAGGENAKPQVFAAVSHDSGATWGKEISVSDSPVLAWVPSIAATGKNVYVAWVDGRDGNEEEYFRNSFDEGKTWGPVKRITHDPANSWAPSIAANGKDVYLVWFDQMDNPFKPRELEKKLDKIMQILGLPAEREPDGVLVDNPEELTKSRAARKMQMIVENASQWARDGGDGSKLQSIIRDVQKMGEMQFSRPRAAEKFLDQALKLIGTPVHCEDENAQVRLRCKLALVQKEGPAWAQNGGDPEKLQEIMNQFQTTVITHSYMEKEKKLDQAFALMHLTYVPVRFKNVSKIYYEDAMEMRVAEKLREIREAAPEWVKNGGDPEKLQGMIQDFVTGMHKASQGWNIYFQRSLDGGITWTQMARLTSHSNASSQRPNCALNGKRLEVVWFDNRGGNNQIYYKHSPDDGKSWGPDIELTRLPGESIIPCVAVSKGRAHVVWEYVENGNSQVYYKLFGWQ